MKIDFDFFKIQRKLAPRQGRIIISEPFLAGNFFSRSTVLLAEYSENGAVGFILNKPVKSKINRLFRLPSGFTPELYIGGPVGSDSLFYIHTLGHKIKESIHIKDELYWGGDFESVKLALELDVANAAQIKFFLGYSGWSPGQLENEIKENSWLVAEADTKLVMNSDRNFWLESVKNAGGHYETWQNFPEDPNSN